MELEAELGSDVLVRPLLKWKSDVEADRFAVRILGAAIGSFHDPWPATAAAHKTVRMIGILLGPFRHHAGQRARVAVILPHKPILLKAGRPEEHNRVANPFAS